MLRTINEMLKADPNTEKELKDILASDETLSLQRNISSKSLRKAMVGPLSSYPKEQAILLMHLRPALLIRDNRIEIPHSVELRKKLLPSFAKIEQQIPSVGRIDLIGSVTPYAGTGWMISENILVTNQHVAWLFASGQSNKISFRYNAVGEKIRACIDFKAEFIGDEKKEEYFDTTVEKILYMSSGVKSEPDIAFLKVRSGKGLPPPVPLSGKKIKKNHPVCVIGYPALDPDGIPSNDNMMEIFQNIFEVKRCSPGEVLHDTTTDWFFFHDCTTLGGSSGSVILDQENGAAVGIHFSGEVLKENAAVKSATILEHLRKIKTKVFINKTVRDKPPGRLDDLEGESTTATFANRKGYNPAFLKFPVRLPVVKKGENQMLYFKNKGKKEYELKYHHFSVVMNEKRRMCFFSACNIDGKASKRGVARTTWKTDGRVPKELQIIRECYGSPPKFSRGHMTRKEDPIWGSLPIARAACADTFHVTNAVPQIQPFNAPVWLALEDYALENARQDDMKISVITGPVFNDEDLFYEGVQVPLEFFKIIAFIHDDTRKLTATGYTVSQASYLGKKEFIFGQFNTYQCKIRSIEKMTGLDFGVLSSVDPLKGRESPHIPIVTMNEIQFI